MESEVVNVTVAGLGLEFARQLLQKEGDVVVATCRHPENATALHELQRRYGNRLRVLKMNTADEESIERAYQETVADFPRIDRLYNVSGLLHDTERGMLPETSFSKIKKENLMRSFETNAWGPILVCKTFLPLLIEAGICRRCVFVFP